MTKSSQSRIVVSIVSHGHQSELLTGGLLESLSSYEHIVRENKSNAVQEIFALKHFFQNLRENGFGTNHNKNFEAAQLADNDWFVICNPDILLSSEKIRELIERAEQEGEVIAAPFLLNESTNSFDHNVRPWPTPLNLARSFFGLSGKSRYLEADLKDIKYPDWSSGALVAIKAGVYKHIRGFDERYFMYMEDVDFCRRASAHGLRVRFFHDLKVVHNAARNSRSIFSPSFRHHLASAFRYFIRLPKKSL